MKMTKTVSTEDAKLLHDSRKKMYDQAEQYRNSFLDKKSGLINQKYLENRSCPVCEATDSKEIFKKGGGTYVICNKCEMIFLNPVFKDDELVRYYQSNNTNQALAHNSEIEFYRRIYTSGLDLICKYKSSGNLLDIGCSSGFFLDISAEKFNPYGIELNKSEVEIARAKGHIVWDKPLDMVAFEGEDKFDVITLWDVFEHIKDGRTYLQNLKSKIRSGGVVFLQIPSADSLAARIMRDKCNMFDGLEHVNLYSRQTIAKVAENAGYRILGMVSVIDELKPLLNYLSYEDPYYGQFRGAGDIDFLSQDLIISKMLGYKLQVLLSPKN
jgi:2-polyprenyl-3-methyl-5-hydroxy-6-metoxy-1,4-benzoquinol methylase